jgi:hypothetical protein
LWRRHAAAQPSRGATSAILGVRCRGVAPSRGRPALPRRHFGHPQRQVRGCGADTRPPSPPEAPLRPSSASGAGLWRRHAAAQPSRGATSAILVLITHVLRQPPPAMSHQGGFHLQVQRCGAPPCPEAASLPWHLTLRVGVVAPSRGRPALPRRHFGHPQRQVRGCGAVTRPLSVIEAPLRSQSISQSVNHRSVISHQSSVISHQSISQSVNQLIS